MGSDRLIWVVPEKSGGIRTYTEALWPSVAAEAEKRGIETSEPLFDPIESLDGIQKSVEALVRFQPTIIHVQHEYGLFGSKIPGLYLFPKWLFEVRLALPQALIFATAHNVLDPQYRFPVRGRSWQIPFRWLANQFRVSAWQRVWSQETWGDLDGVFIHSKFQKDAVESSGCPSVQVIPHFVPKFTEASLTSSVHQKGEKKPKMCKILVFGFITPDKGQDIAIQALARLNSSVQLILAGGPRRGMDQKFIQQCRNIIEKLGLKDRVVITGFVEPAEVDRYYQEADLVLAPFRDTSGSGSLVQALGRGAPVLASDLPLNLEIAEREKGSLAFFRSEDPIDLGLKIHTLLESPEQCQNLRKAALSYARAYAPDSLAGRYLDGYGRERVRSEK